MRPIPNDQRPDDDRLAAPAVDDPTDLPVADRTPMPTQVAPPQRTGEKLGEIGGLGGIKPPAPKAEVKDDELVAGD